MKVFILDSSDRATYFAVNSKNLYVVDANPWVTDISSKLSSEGQGAIAKKLSIVHHIFMFLDPYTLNKENLGGRKTTSSHTSHSSPSQSNSIQSVASINLSGKIDLTFENDLKARSQGVTDDLELFVALTTKGKMMASFVRHKVSTTKDQITSQKDKFTNSQLQFFEKVQAKRLPGQGVPNIKFNGLSRLEELKVGLNTLNIMSKNVENRNSAVDFATDEAKKIVSGKSQRQRPWWLLKDGVFKQLDERIKKISLKLQPLLFPVEYQMQLNEINIRVMAHRNKVLGPSKPFHASASAQKFMLTKNDTEVMQLKNCLEKLLNEAEKFNR
uniref:Uncharacterized protein n=1 Tax=Ditylenchus dipsaci TaxID=166011 RepID=A0A915E3K3_9BILA